MILATCTLFRFINIDRIVNISKLPFNTLFEGQCDGVNVL